MSSWVLVPQSFLRQNVAFTSPTAAVMLVWDICISSLHLKEVVRAKNRMELHTRLSFWFELITRKKQTCRFPSKILTYEKMGLEAPERKKQCLMKRKLPTHFGRAVEEVLTAGNWDGRENMSRLKESLWSHTGLPCTKTWTYPSSPSSSCYHWRRGGEYFFLKMGDAALILRAACSNERRTSVFHKTFSSFQPPLPRRPMWAMLTGPLEPRWAARCLSAPLIVSSMRSHRCFTRP